MSGVIKMEFKIKKEELLPTYKVISTMLKYYDKKIKSDIQNKNHNKDINDLGMKGLVRFYNELDLYMGD